MFSPVRPAMIEWTPHESLPSIPPSVQRSWVTGSGAKVRPWRSAALRRLSSTTPGWTRAMRRSGSIDAIRVRWRETSITTAAFGSLAGEARPAAAQRHRSVVRGADGDRLDQVVGVDRPNHADGDVAIVRRVGRVQRSFAGVEPDLAANPPPQVGGQGAVAGVGRGRPGGGAGGHDGKDSRQGRDGSGSPSADEASHFEPFGRRQRLADRIAGVDH